jgi:hypothetical protein
MAAAAAAAAAVVAEVVIGFAFGLEAEGSAAGESAPLGAVAAGCWPSGLFLKGLPP